MDLNHPIEKWMHVLERVGCQKARREQISIYLENQVIKNPTNNLLLSNVMLLSRLTIDDYNIIFFSQAKRIEKILEFKLTSDSLVEDVEKVVINKVLELTQEEINKSNIYCFSGNIIDKISLKSPSVLEVIYNCYYN